MRNYPAQAVLDFWFGRGAGRGKTHKRWFEKNQAFDAEIRSRFLTTYEEQLREESWLAEPSSCLARIVVLDQFPRNMFRGTARAFEADPLALAAARHAIERGYDGDWLRVEKIFAYLPFEHSEVFADQARACDLVRPLGEEQYDYALRHKAIIERFGRFPHRNALLGRTSTPAELEFLKEPGSSF
jgi:uncharacterized protein (DUF924 family)